MSLGQVQTIITCSSEQDGTLSQGACPAGQYAKPIQAYVISADSGTFFDGLNKDFDYTQASGFFTLAFGTVVSLYLVSKMAGQILHAIRTF